MEFPLPQRHMDKTMVSKGAIETGTVPAECFTPVNGDWESTFAHCKVDHWVGKEWPSECCVGRTEVAANDLGRRPFNERSQQDRTVQYATSRRLLKWRLAPFTRPHHRVTASLCNRLFFSQTRRELIRTSCVALATVTVCVHCGPSKRCRLALYFTVNL